MNNSNNSSLNHRPATKSGRHISRVLALAGAASLLTLLMAGCQSADEPGYLGAQPVGAKVFKDEDLQTRSLNRIVNAQAAVAARNDSTLRPFDFYGPDLNGLGQQKLDLITLDDRPVNPLVIYLDMPEDSIDARRTTVQAYLKDKGLKDDQIKVESGPNPSPDAASLAAPGLKTLHLLDGGAAVANPEPATGGGGAAGGASSGGGQSAAPNAPSVPGAPPSH